MDFGKTTHFFFSSNLSLTFYIIYNKSDHNRVLKKDRIAHEKFKSTSTSLSKSIVEPPQNSTGPLDTFWKARNAEGYIINYDGSLSPCVHQWERWYKDLHKFVDEKLF